MDDFLREKDTLLHTSQEEKTKVIGERYGMPQFLLILFYSVAPIHRRLAIIFLETRTGKLAGNENNNKRQATRATRAGNE